MLTFACFDPYTLSIVIDYGLLANALPRELVSVAYDAGVTPSLDSVARVREIADPALRSRAIMIAAAIWHEKRHFFDYVLTGYGSNIVRGAMTRTMYARFILRAFANAKQELVVPIDGYANAATRAVLGISEAPATVRELLAECAKTRCLLTQHTLSLTTKHGPMRLSGLTALEALGFYAEAHAVLMMFGIENYRAYYDDLTPTGTLNLRYRWADFCAGPTRVIAAASEQLDALNVTSVVAAIVGALGGGSDIPGAFIAINEEMERRGLLRDGVGVPEAWGAVNEIVRKGTGSSVSEALRVSYEREAELFVRIPSFARTVLGDLPERFHRLRGELIDMLEREPANVLDMGEWVKNVLPLLQPHYILVYPSGVDIADVPSGFQSEWNASFPYRDGVMRWCWALGKDPYEPVYALASAKTLAIGAFPEWRGIVDSEAPLAKLLASGRRQDVLFGPELDRAEYDARASVSLRFDPAFEQPVEWGDAEKRIFYHLHRTTCLPCARCAGAAEVEEAVLLSSWRQRKIAPLREDAPPEAFLARFRDWSPHVLCAMCYGSVTGSGVNSKAL